MPVTSLGAGEPLNQVRKLTRTALPLMRDQDPVEASFDGWADQPATLERLGRPLPLGRGEQRQMPG